MALVILLIVGFYQERKIMIFFHVGLFFLLNLTLPRNVLGVAEVLIEAGSVLIKEAAKKLAEEGSLEFVKGFGKEGFKAVTSAALDPTKNSNLAQATAELGNRVLMGVEKLEGVKKKAADFALDKLSEFAKEDPKHAKSSLWTSAQRNLYESLEVDHAGELYFKDKDGNLEPLKTLLEEVAKEKLASKVNDGSLVADDDIVLDDLEFEFEERERFKKALQDALSENEMLDLKAGLDKIETLKLKEDQIQDNRDFFKIIKGKTEEDQKKKSEMISQADEAVEVLRSLKKREKELDDKADKKTIKKRIVEKMLGLSPEDLETGDEAETLESLKKKARQDLELQAFEKKGGVLKKLRSKIEVWDSDVVDEVLKKGIANRSLINALGKDRIAQILKSGDLDKAYDELKNILQSHQANVDNTLFHRSKQKLKRVGKGVEAGAKSAGSGAVVGMATGGVLVPAQLAAGGIVGAIVGAREERARQHKLAIQRKDEAQKITNWFAHDADLQNVKKDYPVSGQKKEAFSHFDDLDNLKVKPTPNVPEGHKAEKYRLPERSQKIPQEPPTRNRRGSFAKI